MATNVKQVTKTGTIKRPHGSMLPPENKPVPLEGPFHVTGVRILTGKVDLAIQVQRLKDPSGLLLEIFATVLTAKPGTTRFETILLLRNVKKGPIIQVSYFAIDKPLPETLKNVRCICRVTCLGRIQALRVQELSPCCSTTYIARLSAISAHIMKDIVRERSN